MCLMWVDAGVFAPLIVALVTGNLAVKNQVRNSLITSGK